MAETVGVAVRGLFEYLGKDSMRNRTGVVRNVMAGIEPPERTSSENVAPGANALRVPVGDDVVRIMTWADTSSAPERDRLAAKLVVYSVQRRAAVARARKADFESAGPLGGLWKLPALHRKTAAMRARRGIDVGAHVVPLPPSAWAVVKRAIALAEDSEFLFPAERDRKAGKPATTLHPDSLTHIFSEIPGNDVSPHDMRRAFGTTYANAAKLTPHAVKQILDHSEGVESGDVTASHYMFTSGTHEKWPTMQGYVAWVDNVTKRGTI